MFQLKRIARRRGQRENVKPVKVFQMKLKFKASSKDVWQTQGNMDSLVRFV